MKKNLFLVSVLFYTLVCSSQIVTTFAGSDVNGYADGTGISAKFNGPSGVCTDLSGNVYVADMNNNRIRKITPAGEVTTFAGSGVNGYADGTGTATQFNAPVGVCIDAAGNLYVADAGNHRIRKITPARVVTTFAGSGVNGFADGTGTAARFNNPQGLCIDASGNLYIADRYNQRIRKITPSRVVTTLAGSGNAGLVNGTGTAAWFNSPFGVCADTAGNVYVADSFNNGIRKITPAGVVTIFAGAANFDPGSTDGIGTEARFDFPTGVFIDVLGNVYVADKGNNRIRKITSAGVVTTFAGSAPGYADGTGISAKFAGPSGICTDLSGNMYVADSFNNRIRKIVITPLGVSQNTLTNNGVIIYPNPSSDKFTIDFGNETVSNYTIKINNLLGQEVYRNVIDKSQFEVIKTWQGEGMYFVKILNAQNEVISVKKIMLY